MTEKSPLSKRISKSYLILLFALICGIVFITILFASFCISENKNIESNYLAKIAYTGEAIKNAIHVTNTARYAYELRYDERVKVFLDDFYAQFSLAGGDPYQIDLEELQLKYQELHPQGVTLYILDDTNTIIASTEPEEIGYDFSEIPEFANELSKIRNGDKMVIDVTSLNSYSWMMSKYGYIPSSNNDYLLEIGLIMSDFSLPVRPLYAGLDVDVITTPNTAFLFARGAEIQQNPEEGLVKLGRSENVLTEFPERMKYLSRAFLQEESFSVHLPGEEKRVDYHFISSSPRDAPSRAFVSQVLEVTTDFTPLQQDILQNTFFFIMITLICDGVFICMGLLIIWYVVNPINLIIDDIETIANGAYDHKIRQPKGPEFDRLEASITTMVSRLKEELQENKEKTKQLDLELKQRKAVEESLVNATKHLNLLSSITRHDILNQVMVATSLLDLMADESGDRGKGADIQMDESLFHQFRTSIEIIEKQIQFTKLYDQIGHEKPVWQPVSPQIAEAERDLRYLPDTVCNNVSSLHVLANPMFDRVVYNLLDNAKRYATGMTSFMISFIEQDSGEGLLVFEDNGCGIDYEMKKLIFMRGYGSNTGFGLYLSREILFITDIEITETGVPGEGSRFELLIPPNFWRWGE